MGRLDDPTGGGWVHSRSPRTRKLPPAQSVVRVETVAAVELPLPPTGSPGTTA